MTTPTLTTIPDLLHALRDAAPEYPPALLASRREAFQQSIKALNDDPADCSHIDTEPVSDEQDERNSHPL